MTSRRILHLADHSARGGASRAAFRLHTVLAGERDIASQFLGLSADWLAQNPDSSRGKTTDPLVFRNSRANRAALLVRHFMGSRARLVFDFFAFRNVALEHEVRRVNPDALVIHWVKARDVPFRSLRKMQTPLTLVLHDARFLIGDRHYPSPDKKTRRQLSSTEFVISRLMKWFLAPLPVGLIFPSDWMRSLARSCGWLAEEWQVVPYPIDLQFWSPNAQIRKGPDSTVLRIGFGFSGPGSAYRKGQDLIFDALEIIEGKGATVKSPLEVYLFGDAQPPANWGIANSGVRLRNMGALTDGELRDLYRRIDLLVVPSRAENLAQIALEAQATGTPALVASSTGLESTICNESGEHFHNGSASDLAQKISRLLSTKGLLGPQATAARQHAVSKFSSEVVAKKFLEAVWRG